MSGTSINIITPSGMFGPQKDYLVESIIRAISDHFASEEEWAEKYGTDFENDIFMIHRFCWCDSEDCAWCRVEDPAPNFHYKPLDFKVNWYKYIGRSMEYNKNISINDCIEILKNCIESKQK